MEEYYDYQEFNPFLDYAKATTQAGFMAGGRLASTGADDLLSDLGHKTYEQMLNDPKIAKCISVLKTGVVGNNVEMLPNLSDTDPEYAISQEIASFCGLNFKSLQRPFREIIFEMLDAIVYGHKVGEITWKIGDFNGRPYLMLSSIKPKPFDSTNFIVDEFFNVKGLVVRNSYLNSLRKESSLSLNKDSQIKVKDISKKADGVYLKLGKNLSKFEQRDKFFILTVNGSNNDPRGKSILRPVYNAWNVKRQIICDWLVFLKTAAFPLLAGFAPEDAKENIVVDGNVPVKDANGKVLRQNPVSSLRDALLQAKNNYVVALRGGSEIKEIGGKGTGVAFYKALEVYDEQIEMALLNQTLATSEGRHQTRASSDTHYTTLDQLIQHYKELVSDAITKDLLEPLIVYNFGPQYLKYMPKVTLGDTQRRDFSLDAVAIAALYTSGYLSEDQKRFTDLMLQLPVRDSNYDKNRTVSAEEQLRIRSSVLEHQKLKNEGDKAYQESNRLISEQINSLSKLLVIEGLNASIKTEVESKISELIKKLTSEASYSYLDELSAAQTAAKEVLSLSAKNVIDQPDYVENGNIDLISGVNIGSNSASPMPTSITAARGGYIKQVKRGY